MTSLDAQAEKEVTDILGDRALVAPLPDVGRAMVDLIHSPLSELSISKLVAIAKRDPKLGNRLIRIANSPFFERGKRITTISHAITLIGLADAVDMMTFYSVNQAVPRFKAVGNFTYDAFWSHARACAWAAWSLGAVHQLGTQTPGQLYLAGLLHGLGKVVLALRRPETFNEILSKAAHDQVPFHVAEGEALACSHADLTPRLLGDWGLPKPIRMAAQYYNNPVMPPSQYQEIAGWTQVAFALANASQIGFSGSSFEAPLTETLYAKLGANPLSNAVVREKVVGETLQSLQSKSKLIQAVVRDSTNDIRAFGRAPSPHHSISAGGLFGSASASRKRPAPPKPSADPAPEEKDESSSLTDRLSRKIKRFFD